MNGAYQIINFDDIEFTTGTAELVVGAYKKITDTAKRFVITHLNLDDETYKDIQLTFENVEGTFVGTGVVNGKLAVVSIASTDQVTVSLNDIAGGITSLENAISVINSKLAVNTVPPEDLVFQNDATIGNDGLSIRKIGNMVIINGDIDTTNLSGGVMMTIPEGYRPSNIIPFLGKKVDSTECVNVWIFPTGEFLQATETALVKSNKFTVFCVYIVN